MTMNFNNLATKFIIGFDGTTLSDDLKNLHKIFPFGGILLLKKNILNPSQLFELIREFQALSPTLPLFISIDHEGGRVLRLDEPFTKIPKAELFGFNYEKPQSIDLVIKTAQIIATELLTVGINLNFAPVLDINTNPKNPIIGDRAFSSNPEIVSTLACAMIGEWNRMGLLCCGKHFPGHGDTSLDSHLALPTLPFDEKRLKEIELVPFIQAIKANLPMIMTGHIKFENIDAGTVVTLSKYFISEILRNQLGFKGLIISDDMEMKAIKDNYPMEEWILQSQIAGIDLLIISKDVDVQYNSFQRLIELYENNNVQKDFIDKSIDLINKTRKGFKPPAKFNPDNIGKIENKKIIDFIRL